jgi:hypothetical protein
MLLRHIGFGVFHKDIGAGFEGGFRGVKDGGSKSFDADHFAEGLASMTSRDGGDQFHVFRLGYGFGQL